MSLEVPNLSRFMPDILNINTRIMHYKPRSSQNLGKIHVVAIVT